MEAKGLRLGNIVKCKISNDATVYAIWSISYKGIGLSGNRDGEIIPESKIKPIPITEEWLTKFGFDTDGICFYKSKFTIGIFVNEILIWLPTGSLNSYVHGVDLQYVHQLQNLYFALTGEELEVIL